MTLASTLLALAIGQAPAVPGPLSAWKLSGTFVQEQAVYDARSARTLDDLCDALAVKQDGSLELRQGALRLRGDPECAGMPFQTQAVAGDHARGSFLDCWGEPDAHDYDASPVELWSEGETIVVRGALDGFGACAAFDDLDVKLRRFVPVQRLDAAARQQAARLGLDLRSCDATAPAGAGPAPEGAAAQDSPEP